MEVLKVEKIIFLLKQRIEGKVNKKLSRINVYRDLMQNEFNITHSRNLEFEIKWWESKFPVYEKELIEYKEKMFSLIEKIESLYNEFNRCLWASSIERDIFKLKTKVYNRNYKNNKNKN